jgi:hypothetical protein
MALSRDPVAKWSVDAEGPRPAVIDRDRASGVDEWASERVAKVPLGKHMGEPGGALRASIKRRLAQMNRCCRGCGTSAPIARGTQLLSGGIKEIVQGVQASADGVALGFEGADQSGRHGLEAGGGVAVDLGEKPALAHSQSPTQSGRSADAPWRAPTMLPRTVAMVSASRPKLAPSTNA